MVLCVYRNCYSTLHDDVLSYKVVSMLPAVEKDPPDGSDRNRPSDMGTDLTIPDESLTVLTVLYVSSCCIDKQSQRTSWGCGWRMRAGCALVVVVKHVGGRLDSAVSRFVG